MIVCEPDTEHHSNVVDATIKAIQRGDLDDELGSIHALRALADEVTLLRGRLIAQSASHLQELQELRRRMQRVNLEHDQLAESLLRPRPADERAEDDGPVPWWRVPTAEPPYAGSPLDHDFLEHYHTHWSRIPALQAE